MRNLTNCFARQFLSLIIFLFLSVIIVSGQMKVSGRVTDNNGNPIQRATVVVKETKNGTTTDADGNYSITVPIQGKTLVFSSLNTAPVEVVVGSQTAISPSLKSIETVLGEVVVVGYGTQKRTAVTGANYSVIAKLLLNFPLQVCNRHCRGV